MVKFEKASRDNKNVRSILRKVDAGLDLPFRENIVVVFKFYFDIRRMLVDLFHYLKFNFDFLLYSLFEESLESLESLSEYDRRFFNTSQQIF